MSTAAERYEVEITRRFGVPLEERGALMTLIAPRPFPFGWAVRVVDRRSGIVLFRRSFWRRRAAEGFAKRLEGELANRTVEQFAQRFDPDPTA